MKSSIKVIIWIFLLTIYGCKSEPPNIIFLLTDDQRWDAMGCMDNPDIQTPEMDKLANEGVLFTHAYVTTPICAVSRASILSGQYARRHGIIDFSTHFTDSAYQYTYPIQLKEAGYYIGFIGKYGVGKEEDFPKDQYDYWGCFPGQGKYWHQDSLGNPLHLTTILGNRAIEFLNKAPDDKPFCLSVSLKAPHSQDGDPNQFLFDSTFIDLYKNKLFATPQTADSSYWYDFPEFFRNHNEARIRWGIRFSTQEKFQHSMRSYYRLIYGVNVQIKRIREWLKKHGQNKNTIIVLMGDNGFYLAEHGMAGKWYAHQESIRVPLIVYDPRAPEKNRGIKNDEIVLNIDVAPTILDLAGLPAQQMMQGKSIMPLLMQKNVTWRNEFLFEHPFKYSTIPRSEGIITKEWKYIRYIDRQPGYEWLFHTTDDSLEIKNLAEDDFYANEKIFLKKQFETLRKECE